MEQPNRPHRLQTVEMLPRKPGKIRIATHCPDCGLVVPNHIPMAYLPSCVEPGEVSK